jgi:acetyl esterase/lipase
MPILVQCASIGVPSVVLAALFALRVDYSVLSNDFIPERTGDQLMFLRRRFFCLSLACLVFSDTALAKPSISDIEYAQVDEYLLKLDLDFPAQEVKAGRDWPLIVWVHGGAWRSGSKNDVPIASLTKRGFAIASVDYRLSPQARFPAQVHDIKAAIRFLRAHAEEYRLDPTRFVIAGASAGGHLAALVGVSAGVEDLEGDVGDYRSTDASVQAIVSFYGASNLHTILSQSTEYGLSVRVPALELLLGGQPDAKPELARLASPVEHVDASDPPLWLIHGDADPQMPPEQSIELQKVYRKHELTVSLEMLKGAKHGGAIFYEPQRLASLANEWMQSLDANTVGNH